MATELSTLGIKMKWAVEVTAGTRPVTGYAEIHGVKSLPEISSEPSALDTTTLAETKLKTYIRGLADPGSTLSIKANDYTTFRDDWKAMSDAWETAKAANKALWVEFYVPSFLFKTGSDATDTAKCFYFMAEPSELLFGGAEVDSVLEINASLTYKGGAVWAAADT